MSRPSAPTDPAVEIRRTLTCTYSSLVSSISWAAGQQWSELSPHMCFACAFGMGCYCSFFASFIWGFGGYGLLCCHGWVEPVKIGYGDLVNGWLQVVDWEIWLVGFGTGGFVRV